MKKRVIVGMCLALCALAAQAVQKNGGKYYLCGEHKVYGRAGNKAHVGGHIYSSDDLERRKDDALMLPNGRRITRSMITGHRGDARSVPENTLMAFRRAVDNGFCFECDFYMTNDGEVYCVHDMNLKRTFGIAGLATNVCWKGTLDKVDVGAIKGPQFAGRADCRVPRIDEVFALIPDDGRKITLEVKDPRPEIVPLIQAAWRRHPNMKEENIIFLAHKATRAALVKAFPRATFQHCVNCYSDGWRKGCTPIPVARQLAELDARPECRNFSPMFDLDLLTPDYIASVHRRGVTFYTWCVDRPEDAVEVFGRGVDGICSNCPVELWDGLKAICAASKTARYTAARVDEIAKWLPERPAACGARIGDRAAWDRLAALPSAAARIRAAEKMLSDPIPELTDDMYMEFSRSGNRSHYRQKYDRLYFGLADLTLGECLENKGRFLPAIVAHIEAICSLRSWTYPAHDQKLLSFNGSPHIDVGSARLTAYLALAYDWLRDVLPPETRARLLAECDRRSFQPYLATCRNFSPKDSVMARRNWWFHGENNWNSACNSGVVRAALAMVEDRRLRAEFIAAAEEAVPYAMRGYLSDGYCTEGMGYWGYGYGNLLMLGLTVRAATGGKVNLFADPKHRAVMMFPYGNRLMEWKSPHFADYAANPSIPLLALERQVFPDITSRRASELDLLAGDEGWSHSDLTFIALRAFGQEPPPDGTDGFDALPPRTWYPEGQVLIARGERPERTMRLSVAIKGGHNGELHNHNDVGSYVIMLDGDEMCGDPGPEVYRAQTFSKDRYLSKVLNSYGHPVPVVGGRLQETGRAAAAKIVRTTFTDARDEIVIDLTAVYSVPALVSLVRTLTFDRTTATITVSDAVTCSEPTSFEVPVITYRDYTKDEKGLQFAFRKKKGLRTLGMTVEASAPVAFRHEVIENKPRPDVTRLGFSFTQPVTNATLSLVYTPSHKDHIK